MVRRQTFNSLYEIRKQGQVDVELMAFLSILFMRFEQALSRLHGTSTMGLSILFMRFHDNHARLHPGQGQAFNSLYEILSKKLFINVRIKT